MSHAVALRTNQGSRMGSRDPDVHDCIKKLTNRFVVPGVQTLFGRITVQIRMWRIKPCLRVRELIENLLAQLGDSLLGLIRKTACHPQPFYPYSLSPITTVSPVRQRRREAVLHVLVVSHAASKRNETNSRRTRRGFDRVEKQMAETDRRMRETDRKMREMHRRLTTRFQRADERIRKLEIKPAKSGAELDERIAKLVRHRRACQPCLPASLHAVLSESL